MNVHELIGALKSHKAGCNGCGYEHNCKDGHCALMVQAADELERLNAFEGSQSRQDNQMEISEIISGLKDLIKDREALMDDDCDSVFAHDKAVLEAAVQILNQKLEPTP
ncbi:MAG: hypothetical protein ACFWUC_02120 [Oscillospiraceae bacterium]|jgi:hypothetical protein